MKFRSSWDGLTSSFRTYSERRKDFLKTLGPPHTNSNRDPFAEFSEAAIRQITNSEYPKTRVNKHFDLISPTGEKIQVKYLTNTEGKNQNGRDLEEGDYDVFAISYFLNLRFIGVVFIPKKSIQKLYEALEKNHARTDKLLSLSAANVKRIFEAPEKFQELKIVVIKN